MRWLRYIVIAINAIAALALLAIGIVAWLIGSEPGSAWLVGRLAARAAPALTIGATRGTFADRLTLEQVSVVRGDDRAEIDSLTLSLDLGRLAAGAVAIESLSVGPARISYTPDPAAPASARGPIELPVALIVQEAVLARVEVTVSGETRVVEETRFAGSLTGTTLEIERFESRVDGVALGSKGRIELLADPELDLDVEWSGDIDNRRWAGRGSISGAWPIVTIDMGLEAPVSVRASGDVDLSTEPVVDLELSWTDLAWPGVDAVVSPSGALTLEGSLEAVQYRATGRLLAADLGIEFSATGHGSARRIELEPLELVTASGSATATGRFDIAERRFDLSVQARDLDPAFVASGWPGRIDASGELRAVLEPELRIEVDRVTLEGQVRDYPFTATLAGQFRPPRAFVLEHAEILSGQDRVSLNGTLDETIALAVEAHTEQLELLWPGLDGVVDARLALAGSLDEPRAMGTLGFARLEFAGNALEAATLSGSAELHAGGALDLALTGMGLKLGNAGLASVDGRLAGTVGAHELSVTLDAPDWRTALSGRGALDGSAWEGRLDSWELEQAAAGLWRLGGAASVRLAAGSVIVEETCLGRLDAELCIDLMLGGTDDDRLSMRARDFDLEMLAPILPEGFRLDGLYALDARFTDLAGEPSGTISIEGGTTLVEFSASENDRVATQIDDARMTASLERGRLSLAMALDGREAGRVSVTATVDDVRDELSPLQGRVQANWTDLSVLSLVSPDVGAMSGAAEVVLDFAGTLDEPTVQGRADWRDGRAEIPAWGVTVERIAASATSADGTALDFDASGWVEDAELRLTGRVELDRNEGWPTSLRLTGASVPLVQLPEAEVYVSPELEADVRLPNISVEGTVLVPRARLALDELPEQAVRPSDDVVVHGGEGPAPVRPLNVEADIRVVLGDDVTYTGSNLDSTLSGGLRLRYSSGQTANASGTLSLDGSYDAYGQSLDLERGELVFTGPLDDPTLDVRAVRVIGETTVGVALAGTLQSPQTRLFSDPAMSEADALAYLLLGRPLEGSGDRDSELVQSAALSMGLQQALPVVQRIGETLRLDELSIETNEVDTGALMAGKYLSPNVYIRYSYGLFNRIGGVLLRFKINDRFSLETRSGDEKSMDLLYTVEKD